MITVAREEPVTPTTYDSDRLIITLVYEINGKKTMGRDIILFSYPAVLGTDQFLRVTSDVISNMLSVMDDARRVI